MARNGYSAEQIVNKLRDADVLLSQRRTVAHMSKQIGVIDNLRCERICSAAAPCRQRGTPIFTFLLDTLNAHLRGKPTPSLIHA